MTCQLPLDETVIVISSRALSLKRASGPEQHTYPSIEVEMAIAESVYSTTGISAKWMPLGTKESVPICWLLFTLQTSTGLSCSCGAVKSKPLTARTGICHCIHESDYGEMWAYGKRQGLLVGKKLIEL